MVTSAFNYAGFIYRLALPQMAEIATSGAKLTSYSLVTTIFCSLKQERKKKKRLTFSSKALAVVLELILVRSHGLL